MNHRISVDKALTILMGAVVAAYVCSIFAVNILGRGFVNFDMYSDIILARYIALEKTLFPDGWHFGNQIYTVATPIVASLVYRLIEDAYLSMAIASCVMTSLCIISFVWCVKPFVKPRNVIVGLLVFVGGTNLARSAHEDWEGLQLFYTMASYYSCYVIGILITLGVWCRYKAGIPVRKSFACITLLFGFALGVQSLRQTLVLNLPLCVTAVLLIIFDWVVSDRRKNICEKHGVFTIAALLFNVGGVLLNKLLVSTGTVVQHEFFRRDIGSIGQRLTTAVESFVQYIGINAPAGKFAMVELAVAIFSLLIVVTAIVKVLQGYIRHKGTTIGDIVLYLSISLCAVFVAGVFVIPLRQIYYFCWYLLVSMCAIYHAEYGWILCKRFPINLARLMAIVLICISVVGYMSSFLNDFKSVKDTRRFYQNMVNQLSQDGIKYVYSDWRDQINMISTMSGDEITYVTQAFSNNSEDLWDKLGYLYKDSWFEQENYDNAYVILTDSSKIHLERDFLPEYVDALMSNLELVHEMEWQKGTVYFYRGTEKLYHDMTD